jgi:hypothetical protein
MLRHRCKTVHTLWFGVNRETGRTLCHTHLVKFSVFLCTFRPKGTKNGYFTGKNKMTKSGWMLHSFFFETPTSRTQKILLRSRNIPPNTPGFLK